MPTARQRGAGEAGYAMAVLLVTLAIMGVAVGVAMPTWRTIVQRDKEEELIFRGRQYTRAIGLFQRRFANAYPPSFDVLVEQKFLRKKYADPMATDGEFEILYQGSAVTLPGGRAGQSGSGESQTLGTGSTFSGGRGTQSASGGRQGSSLLGAGSAQAARGGQAGRSSSSFGFTTTGRGAGPLGGVIGVVSKSTNKSIRVLDGRTQYNEWQFVWLQRGIPGRGGGALQPGGRGGRGEQGGFGTPGFGSGQGRGQGGGRGQGRGGMSGGSGQGPGGGRQPGRGRGPA